MFLTDPPASEADLHFRVFGFPVRIHPFFWLIAVILGIRLKEPVAVLIWVVAVFVSILIHELGHALAIRFYGGFARIVLYGLGGLAIEDHVGNRRPGQQIVISFAGPAAGFLFAALVVLLIAALGNNSGFVLGGGGVPAGTVPVSFLGLTYYFQPFLSRQMWLFVVFLLHVNVFWGLINLLPVYPLDGGQISREFFVLQNPRQGITRSLWVSTIAAAAVAFYAAAQWQAYYMAILFGYLAYSSWSTNQRYTGRGRGPVW